MWESISGDGFHKQVWGYSLATEFLFYECNEITKEDKAFPILFLMRNLIELGLKRMFYKTIEHGVPRKVFMSKRKSHLLYKELWKNVRPMIEFMQAIFNFCDGCDGEFEAVAEWEVDVRSELSQYEECY